MNAPPPQHPRTNLTILQKLRSAYKLWHEYLFRFPKTSRYTLGAKIDGLFVETLEQVIIASFLEKSEKLPFVKRAIVKLDVLKFFVETAWDIHSLQEKHFIVLSEPLHETGKMLGGWRNQLIKQTSPPSVAEKK